MSKFKNQDLTPIFALFFQQRLMMINHEYNKREEKMDVIKKLSLLMVLIVISSCSRGFKTPVGYDAPGLDELKRLCEKDAGLTINKSVEAKGYYDATRKGGVLWKLIPSGFNFVEYCNLEPNIMSLFDEPGCWRLIKISRETGQCNANVDKSLMRVASDTSIEYRKQNCIAVEKIEKPTARYSYQSGWREWVATDEVSKYTRTDVYIKDSQTSEVLGRYISYSYIDKPRHALRKSCDIFEGDYPSYVEANLINSVLKPVSKGVNHD